MGVNQLPGWYKEWWDHTCKEGTEWLHRYNKDRVYQIRSYNQRNGYDPDRGLDEIPNYEALLAEVEEDEREGRL
jgi:hypothetical protein